MKIIKDQIPTFKRGRLVTVELATDEHLIAVKDDSFYRLGGQVDDIVQGHVITELHEVYWCSITQKWEQK